MLALAVIFRQEQRVFLYLDRLHAEHEVEEHLIVMLGQILDSLDHTLDKLDLLIVVALDSIILQTSFIFRELRDHVFEALARQRRQSLILE